nr:type VI secretion system tip protein TssI/VgrG [Alteromonas sp. ASW11-130]
MVDNPIDFRVAKLSGCESISELYHFELELMSEDTEVSFDEMIGKSCVITIQGINHTEEDGSFTEEIVYDRFIHGIVASFALADEATAYSTYLIEVVPRLWPLRLKINSRIFQKQSVKDIVSSILNELGLTSEDYKWQCQSQYQAMDYCVQYQESEFDFISRLLEENGVYYYFQHEAEKHVLIFDDDSSSCKPIEDDSTLPYASASQGLVTNQVVTRFQYRQTLAPDRVAVKDYNFLKPTLNLLSKKDDGRSDYYEVFNYPGRYLEKSAGDQQAKLRMETLLSSRERGTGISTVNRLTPGYTFSLDDQRRGNFTADYLITSVTHTASQLQSYEEYTASDNHYYSNEFAVINTEVKFRPAVNTPKPSVRGTQTAIVTGPSGEEIYTDEHGRVKVQFHWDRYGNADESSSCWIRVSQMWAGQGYGGFALPRIGQEVIIDFEEGDPDRPLIIGRVHHGDNRSPYKLPDRKTVSTLKTNSSKGGEGFNELRFEDEKGKEQIFVHAERNMDERIKKDKFKYVGNDSHKIIKNDSFTHIENDRHQVVDNDSFLKITGDVHNNLEANLNQDTGGSESYSIGEDRKSNLVGSENIKAGMDIKLQAGTNYGLKAGVNAEIKAGMTINLEASAAINLKVGGSFISINPGGVFISGLMVMINSGGMAGPANPAPPAKPDKVTSPVEAKEADKAEAGKVEKVKAEPMPVRPSKYGPQAKAMKQAAESGTPFCEQCEAAKKKNVK